MSLSRTQWRAKCYIKYCLTMYVRPDPRKKCQTFKLYRLTNFLQWLTQFSEKLWFGARFESRINANFCVDLLLVGEAGLFAGEIYFAFSPSSASKIFKFQNRERGLFLCLGAWRLPVQVMLSAPSTCRWSVKFFVLIITFRTSQQNGDGAFITSET